MKVSVIVPVYNTAEYVDRCLAALLAQDYPRDRYEVIAVDNGSTDDSRRRLLNHPVVVVDEPKRGSYAARNTGIRASTGDVLAFTDSDCAPSTQWLRTIKAALERPGIQVVQGERMVVSASQLLLAINRYECNKDAYVFRGDQALKYYGYTNNMAMRRSTWERYGPFVERDRGADTIFVRSVVDGESCHAVIFDPEMVVNHLEMKNFRDYQKKMFIYGRSRKRYRRIQVTRALAAADRLRILQQTVRERRYAPWRVAMLAGGLTVGMAAWQLGSWAGSIESLFWERT